MIVNEVSIKNFKSLENVHFNAKRVNVFIGEPNSGKSNLLEALSLFSTRLKFGEDVFKETVRFENIGNLFFDNDLSRKIEIFSDLQKIRIELGLNQIPGKQIEFLFHYEYKNISELKIKEKDISETPEWIHNRETVDFTGKQIIEGGPIYPSLFRAYIFKRLSSFDRTISLPRLNDPFGNNIPFLLSAFPNFKNLVSDFFRDKGYFLNIKPADNSIELAKNTNNIFITYPYLTISETLQRIVFISLAIATNKDSILIFDEPESNTFPFYTKYIAETIANDKSNQYFLTTHNPFLLMNLVEKTPSSELAVFVAKNKNYQTKLYPLNEGDMQEVVNLGHDVFFNLDKFTEKE